MGYVKGIRWSDELMINKIHEVMNALNINRMPSSNECILVTGNLGLSCCIDRHGGFYKIANKLGLKVKNCETTTGKGFEKIAKEMIEDKGYEVERMTTKYPFDLLVNNKVRIDVKSCRPFWANESRMHVIGLNKKYATCDLYLIYALDEEDKPERTFIIPGCDLKITTLSIGKNSKYNIYLNRWDLLKKYNDFYNNLSKIERK